mgnify:CR=1 FL=1
MPFNPTSGSMHEDHVTLMLTIGEYGRAMEELGKSGTCGPTINNPARSPEFDRACLCWDKVLDALRTHFKKHWFNAV